MEFPNIRVDKLIILGQINMGLQKFELYNIEENKKLDNKRNRT